MRYLLLSALLTALPMFSRADDGVALLLNNGSTVTFTFSERPCIATADVISISTPGGVSVQYAYGDVQRVYWADVAPSGIGTAETSRKGDVRIGFADGGIEVCGLAAGETVRAYAPDGSCVAKATATGAQATVLAVPATHKVLLLRTSTGVSCKISRK